MKKWMIISALAIAASVFLLVGCAQEDRGSGVDLSQEKATLRQDLMQSLTRVNQRLEEIEQELADASEDAKEGLQAEQSRLEELKTDLNELMEKTEEQTEETWQEFKRGADEIKVSIEAELGTEAESAGGSGY